MHPAGVRPIKVLATVQGEELEHGLAVKINFVVVVFCLTYIVDV